MHLLASPNHKMAITLQTPPLNTSNIMIPILSFTTALLILLLSKLFRKKPNRPLLPSPPSLPIVGNLHQLCPSFHRSLHSLSNKYGPILLLRLGSIPAVIVSSADLAEQVMKTQDLTFSTRPPSTVASRLFYNCQDVAFARYGEHWRQMRRICVVHLLSIKAVQSFRPVIDEETSRLVSSIGAASPSPVNLSKLVMALTNDIICRVALGRKYSAEEGFRAMLKESSVLLGAFPMKDYIPWLGWLDELSGLNARVRKNFEELDGFLERVLEDHAVRRKEGDFVDFVDVLLSLGVDEEETSGGFGLDRDSVKALIFVSGLDKLLLIADEADLSQMKYLKAVIKESLRLHPPIPALVPREAMEQTELQGYAIPKGTRLFVNVWTISRDPKYWEKPEQFWPERFLKGASFDFRGQDFEFTPFGSGRRGCPGINFAALTVECVLAKLLLCFDWEVPSENRKEVLDMAESLGINASKKYNLLLKAKPRE